MWIKFFWYIAWLYVFAGLVPTPDLINRLYEKKQAVGPWTPGLNVQLAIGQGSFLATPLQVANAYATLANKGRRLRPHLGLKVEDGDGRLLQDIKPVETRKLKLKSQYANAIHDGLRAAASASGGTSAAVFGGFGRPVEGKTGTAQTSKGDQSWYAAIVPDRHRPIVVVMTLEGGGWGAEAAAPGVLRMLEEWFYGERDRRQDRRKRAAAAHGEEQGGKGKGTGTAEAAG